SYVTIALLFGFLPCVASAICALRGLPQVRIWPQLFSWSMVRDTLRFSIFAYISSLSGVILAKTDQLVLGTALAVSAVTIYQVGAKIGEMFTAFAQQLPDTFSPAAAHLNATGDREFLRKLLINGTRFSVMIATPVYFIAAFFMEGILKIITGAKAPTLQTLHVAEVLLLWGYMCLVTQSVTRRIFMMCGHEKKLTLLTLAEALLNLGLSLGLVLYYKNVLCVALGSLIATLIFGWLFIWPWAAREAQISGWQLARIVLFPTWLGCLPLLAVATICHFTPWLDYRTNALLLMGESTAALLAGAFGLWYYALTAKERETLTVKIENLFS
ncbi:MAG: lipopolysaccharide biosynthesis protein, partial [Limisphaerales bacterium]